MTAIRTFVRQWTDDDTESLLDTLCTVGALGLGLLLIAVL